MVDVESNPGPNTYNLLKVVQGSFHQGDPKFGQTAGIQCACNSLFSLCWSSIKRVTVWTTCDLDYVLESGDQLYKSLNINNMLSVDDLPRNVKVEGYALTATMLENENGIMNIIDDIDFLERSYRKVSDTGNGLIFFINGYTFSLIWSKSAIFLCDSHSRNREGFLTPDGTSILLKFKSLNDVQRYITNVYLAHQNMQITFYQLQYIKIATENIDIPLMLNSVKRSRDSKRKKTWYANILGTPEHDTIKAKMQARHANILGTPEHDTTKAKMQARHANILGTPEHDTIKAKMRARHANILGTPEHDTIKAKMRARHANILGTPEHDTIKAKMQARHANILGTPEHDTIKEKMQARYKNILGTPEHDKVKARKRKLYADTTAVCSNDFSGNVKKFRSEIEKGPYFICVVCNRCLYRKSVLMFVENKYINFDSFRYNKVDSYDGCQYICQTCDRKLKRGKIPCQAVCNNLEIFQFPNGTPSLNKLEKVIIGKRILFAKIIVMPKGQFTKIKGAMCNVPIETDNICNILPRGIDSNGLILLKLKRKLCYRGHVLFEPVRPDVVKETLNYLKQNNSLYSDIEINIGNIPLDLLSLDEIPIVREDSPDSHPDQSNELEEIDNPLDRYRLGANDSALIPTIPCQINEEDITIAPGEGIKPLSILTDKHCEELAHPHLFPTGKFGYKVDRKVPLSPIKYFNQRLLNYKQKFSSDPDYIFFAHSVTQQLNLNSRVNIAMQKVKSGQLTAGMLSRNFKESVKSFVANDEAYSFMNTVKGTPAYWKRFLFEVLAMVKQLGLPTFFMTLSCADLRWNELVSIISKLNGLNLSDDDINGMDYFQRCEILNSNPVLLARHFQYRVEVFFTQIIINGPLGKVKYHAIRVEFQFRGSPHIHSFLWVIDAPLLTKETKNEYLNYIDHIIKVELPDKDIEPKLYQMVKTYQIHSHSKSCRKYKNIDCRYSFGRFFTDKTIIAEPLPNDMNENEKSTVLAKRYRLLSKVQNYIDVYLDPRKVNILDSEKPNFEKPKEIVDILEELEIAENDYYHALSISTDNDYQIHFKRPTNSCFVNNYFSEGLMAWKANIDIQPVINHYKAVAYMCAYFQNQKMNLLRL